MIPSKMLTTSLPSYSLPNRIIMDLLLLYGGVAYNSIFRLLHVRALPLAGLIYLHSLHLQVIRCENGFHDL